MPSGEERLQSLPAAMSRTLSPVRFERKRCGIAPISRNFKSNPGGISLHFRPSLVNHKMPSWSKTGVCGSILVPAAGRYSAISPVFGSSLPTYPPEIAVNQMSPSLSATSPCGPELGVFKEYSLNSPVFGSSRPTLFAPCPVYQSEPSGASAGSCGRDFGVGTSYSWIRTFRIPTVVAPASVAANMNKHSLPKDMDVLLRRKL